MKIKYILIWIIIFLFSIGLAYLNRIKDPNIMMGDLKHDFAKMAEKQNKEIELKESRIVEFYRKADIDLLEGVSFIDSIIEIDKSLDKWDISNFHSIVGETLYDYDSIEHALKRFEFAESISFSSPRSKANRAGCYVKMGDYNTALKLLNQALSVNVDFKWYLGNLYEVMNDKGRAIEQYSELYQEDVTVYKYCEDRIMEIEESSSKLLTELKYKDRRKRKYLLLKPTDPNSKNLDIGEFEFKE